MSAKRFRIAFSFAGKKRGFVAKVANILTQHFDQDNILYDRFHEAEFARARLGRYLPKLYHDESDLNVVVICKDYSRSEWCGLEWDAIFGLLKKRYERDVMLCRFDHADVDGLYDDAGFSELDSKSEEETAILILERLAINEGKTKDYYTKSHSLTEGKPSNSSGASSGIKVVCRLNCRETTTDVLHLRPLAFLRKLLDNFPETNFYLSKQDSSANTLGRPADMRSHLDMMFSAFEHGDLVALHVCGKLEVMAAAFTKIALENLEGYSDDPIATKERIGQLIDEASNSIYDPDLDLLKDEPIKVKAVPEQCAHRSVAVINDRLHDVTLPMLPLIAKHFGCKMQLSFELSEKGIFVFEIGPHNTFNLDSQIVDLDIPVGTKVTIVTSGDGGEEAVIATKDVLQNLWQCDHWLRGRSKDWDTQTALVDLLKYAREMANSANPGYSHVRNPFISNLITNNVFVNPSDIPLSKHAVLEQLAQAHAQQHNLEILDIMERVEKAESIQTIVPRPALAIAHAAMERRPRISISLGVYPNGVTWSNDGKIVTLVAMVLFAHDTYNTWRDYLKRFSVLFRGLPSLHSQLLACRNRDEFLKVFRAAEISMEKS